MKNTIESYSARGRRFHSVFRLATALIFLCGLSFMMEFVLVSASGADSGPVEGLLQSAIEEEFKKELDASTSVLDLSGDSSDIRSIFATKTTPPLRDDFSPVPIHRCDARMITSSHNSDPSINVPTFRFEASRLTDIEGLSRFLVKPPKYSETTPNSAPYSIDFAQKYGPGAIQNYRAVFVVAPQSDVVRSSPSSAPVQVFMNMRALETRNGSRLLMIESSIPRIHQIAINLLLRYFGQNHRMRLFPAVHIRKHWGNLIPTEPTASAPTSHPVPREMGTCGRLDGEEKLVCEQIRPILVGAFSSAQIAYLATRIYRELGGHSVFDLMARAYFVCNRFEQFPPRP